MLDEEYMPEHLKKQSELDKLAYEQFEKELDTKVDELKTKVKDIKICEIQYT